MLKALASLIFISLLSFACLDSLDSDEGFSLCDESGSHFFEPSNKTIIPPELGNFIDSFCIPLELSEDRSFYDLTTSHICLLEQQLGLIIDSLNTDFCEGAVALGDLDTYFYQYLGIHMGMQDYIFVSAFKADLVETFDWTNEPFNGKGKNGIKHWSALFNLDELMFEQYQSKLIR